MGGKRKGKKNGKKKVGSEEKEKKVARGEPIALPPLRDDGVDGKSFAAFVSHAREGLDARLGMITESLERSRKARVAAEKKRRARERKAAEKERKKRREGREESGSGEWRMTLASLSLPLHQTQASTLGDPAVLLPSAVESQSAHDAAMARARESIASLYKVTRRGTSNLPPPDILAEPIVFQPSWTSKSGRERASSAGEEETDSTLNDRRHPRHRKKKKKKEVVVEEEEWVAPKLDLDDIVFEPVEFPPLSITPPPTSRRAVVSSVGNELSPELRVATGWAPIRPSVASLAPYSRSPYDLDIHFRSSKFSHGM